MSLSVCLIVKNEERVLGRCLSAAAQFADELIVVDTGSTDRSRDIAREYTEHVFSEPWQNSFARARNFAASKAGCDHVMWIDADDVFYPDEILKMQTLRDRLTPETDVVFMTYRNYGFLTDFGLRDRIHRRELACRWEGDIHEAIRIESSWNLMLCPEITILHKKEIIHEPERNMRIFDEVRDSGRLSGSYMLSYYCRELALRDDARAGEAWEELLKTNPPAGRVQYALVFMTEMLLRQKEYEKCRQDIDKFMKTSVAPFVWGILLILHGLISLFIGVTSKSKNNVMIYCSVAAGFIVLGAGFIALYFFKKKRHEKKVEALLEKYKDLSSQLRIVYNGYSSCVLPSEYTDPRLLYHFQSMIYHGKVFSIGAALNSLLAVPGVYQKVVNAKQQFETETAEMLNGTPAFFNAYRYFRLM